MDIKNSPEKYEDTVVINSELVESVKLSAKILMQGRVDFEFRTTLMRELHDESGAWEIGRWLSGDEKYFLQDYRDEGDLLVGGFTPLTKEEKETFVNILKKHIPKAKFR
jgi:pyruvate formate lyase activating enzyme